MRLLFSIQLLVQRKACSCPREGFIAYKTVGRRTRALNTSQPLLDLINLPGAEMYKSIIQREVKSIIQNLDKSSYCYCPLHSIEFS